MNEDNIHMTFTEITASNLQFSGTDIDSIKFDRMGAEAVFRLLMELGAAKDIKLLWHEFGTIKIMKKFAYPGCDDEGNDITKYGDQMYSLKQFIKTLIRFDRSAHKRMKNVEQKIYQMHSGIDALGKQL